MYKLIERKDLESGINNIQQVFKLFVQHTPQDYCLVLGGDVGDKYDQGLLTANICITEYRWISAFTVVSWELHIFLLRIREYLPLVELLPDEEDTDSAVHEADADVDETRVGNNEKYFFSS